jgi:PhoPQ-activated pathogenicity-related protein
MPYEDILNEIAYTNVGQLVYPTPAATIENQIIEKTQEINDLKDETTNRPSPKSEYLRVLVLLETELQRLVTQNDDIILSNSKLLEQAILDYNALIEKEKLKPEVIAEATRRAFEEDYKVRLAAIELALLEIGGALS